MIKIIRSGVFALAIAVLGTGMMQAPAQAAAAAAPSGPPITIGLIAELSGPLGFYGQETSQAAKIMVDEINASGGLLGRPVKLIVRDSQTQVSEAVEQARDLLFTEKVDFLLHSINSAECVAVGNIAKQAKKIMFSNCANDDFTGKDGSKYLFRIPNITARTQGYAAAEYAHRHFAGAGERYYIIAHDFAFGRSTAALFKQHMRSLDPKVQFVGESWPKLNTASYAPFITAMIDAKPDVVFYSWGFGIPFWQQSAPYDLLKKFKMVSSYWGGSDDLQALPQNAIPVGAVMGGIPWYAVNDPGNAAFVAAYRKAAGKPPFTAAYMEVMTFQGLEAGIKKAQSIDTDKLIKALEGLQFNSVVGPITIRAFDHQGTTPLWTGKAAWNPQRKMGVLTDIVKLPTAAFLPTEAEVRKMRQ